MRIVDILLPLVGEPSAAAIAAIDKCVAVARWLGAGVTAVAIEEYILVRPQVMAAGVDPSGEATRGVSDARSLLRAFDAAAIRFGVRGEQRLIGPATDIPAILARGARLHDLSMIPVKADDDQSKTIVEGLIFESGRAILMCPEESAALLPAALDNVVIAWDHTAPAARAAGDALPMLRAAATVRIVTATDSKTAMELESGAALVGHLAAHGIKAAFEAIAIDGSSVGKVFEAYVKANAVDLLVMGAYRHSRLNEMVWGGATKTIIGRPPCWVLMSR